MRFQTITLLFLFGTGLLTTNAQNTPKNIILMIGDGMGLSHISTGMYANGNETSLERCKHIGLVKTHSKNDLITDSAASATAMSCGEKTHNGVIGLDAKGNTLPTILEYAHKEGMRTGIVATSMIQHATPAAFYAHNISRNEYEEISLDLLNSTIDVAIGGGRTLLEKRKDGRDLTIELQDKGYRVYKSLRKAMRDPHEKMMIIEEKGHLPAANKRTPFYLARASRFAIDQLNNDSDGFFLMIESSQIDWGGHSNDAKYIIKEMLDFNQAIGKVFDFAEEDGETLVIVTADHETGGFALEGGEKMDANYLETDFTTDFHTGTMVPVFAFGPGAEQFMGIMDNTQIFYKMMNSLKPLRNQLSDSKRDSQP